jgi:ring-1,2-phenylacetyl-CoA epoxidase subunit PaaC
MSIELPVSLPHESFLRFVLSLADDELMLGHRDSEWTGHAPILEEDIAFSNIAQDELGHSLVWYSLCEQMTGKSPDVLAFERPWEEFTCCRFVTYPRADFAYSVVRQYLFDEAEQVRLSAFKASSVQQLREIAGKLLREEAYHLLHSKGLVERLGDATESSHRRMQEAVDTAFPQALGMFEKMDDEVLVHAGVFPGNMALRTDWLKRVVPVLSAATLRVPVTGTDGSFSVSVDADNGGRIKKHNAHLKELVNDLQKVYRLAPASRW